MSSQVEAVLAQALSLPGEDRLHLAEALLTSVAPPGEPPFDPAWLAEAKRRVARIDAGDGTLSTWAEVRDRARRSCGLSHG